MSHDRPIALELEDGQRLRESILKQLFFSVYLETADKNDKFRLLLFKDGSLAVAKAINGRGKGSRVLPNREIVERFGCLFTQEDLRYPDWDSAYNHARRLATRYWREINPRLPDPLVRNSDALRATRAERLTPKRQEELKLWLSQTSRLASVPGDRIALCYNEGTPDLPAIAKPFATYHVPSYSFQEVEGNEAVQAITQVVLDHFAPKGWGPELVGDKGYRRSAWRLAGRSRMLISTPPSAHEVLDAIEAQKGFFEAIGSARGLELLQQL